MHVPPLSRALPGVRSLGNAVEKEAKKSETVERSLL
jgi:hypothetical protein